MCRFSGIRPTNATAMARSYHILLIDDDPVFVFVTTKLLHNVGSFAPITVCDNGESALKVLHDIIDKAAPLPDIIFLDLNMPGMNGWQFLKAYAALLPKMPRQPLLYVVSSSISARDINRAKKLPIVQGYISKPLSTQKLDNLFQSLALQKNNP